MAWRKQFARRFDLAIPGAGALLVVLGAVVMLGHLARSDALVQVISVSVPLGFNTAVAFLLGGAGLLFLSFGRWRETLVCGALVLAAGILALTEWVFALDLGLERLVGTAGSAELARPGKMEPYAALCLLLGGAALLGHAAPWRPRWRPAVLGLAGSVIAAVGVAGWLAYVVYQDIEVLPRLAVHGALGFVALGTGIFVSALGEGTLEGERTPRWLALSAGGGLLALTLVSWHVLVAREYAATKRTIAAEATHLESDLEALMAPFFVGAGLEGLAVSRAREFLGRVLGRMEESGYAAEVFADDEEIYSSRDDRRYQKDWGERKEVQFHGKTWRILIWPKKELLASSRSALPEVALALGVLLAGLLAIVVHLGKRLSLRARRLQLTNEILKGEVTERQRAQDIEVDRSRALEYLAAGAPLRRVLEHVVRAVEKARPGMFCSVLLLDKDKKSLWLGAGPSLPDFYNDAIDGIEIGPRVGSCGTAAYLKQRVMVEDVRIHPYWENYRELAERAGLRACWSEPIILSDGDVVGTFAMYYREPREPDAADLDFIKSSAHLAGIAIELKMAEQQIQKLSVELKERVNEGAVQLNVASKELEAFSQSVSHDIRSRLDAVAGCAQALFENHFDRLDEEGRNYLRRIRTLTQEAEKLMDDMLSSVSPGSDTVAGRGNPW